MKFKHKILILVTILVLCFVVLYKNKIKNLLSLQENFDNVNLPYYEKNTGGKFQIKIFGLDRPILFFE